MQMLLLKIKSKKTQLKISKKESSMRQSDQSFDMILVKQVTFSSGVMMRTTWR